MQTSLSEQNEIQDKIREFKADFNFKMARRLITKSMEKYPQDVWLSQQLALSTYKDEELPRASRFAEAIKILEGIGLRDNNNKDAETLALGGAVYKRLWEYDGQLEHIYEALSFYRAAFIRNPEQDQGYGGINAAFILDILAARSRAAAHRTGTDAIEARKFAEQANELRNKIIDQLNSLLESDPQLKKQNWFVVTMAEAFFGKGAYGEAGDWLAISSKLDGVSEWQRQTTFRQLVSLARYQGVELPAEDAPVDQWAPAWQALTSFLGEKTSLAFSCYRGKVGLALSGGGFRASLYHIGVLARLAEMDVLRSVEVISTVSGGSIVGAHYYLEVKHLLETKTDHQITKQDYIDIVRRVQKTFLQGVQKNIRTMAVADFSRNKNMIFKQSYGRSHRLGELYEALLYSQVADNHPKDQPRRMHDLLIQPKGEPSGFKPKFSNWRRRAKVPALLINATTLNTGHNWRFTAKSMGEPPGLLGGAVDKNKRYRRLYYKQAPEHLRDYRLGYAVAASACVPGLFDPLTLDGLYPDKVVRLVDGGVHDNQGVAGLLDEGCTYVLCSDAAGQMEDKDRPSAGLAAVLMRSNSIMMDRVREAEYQDLRARLESRALQGLFFVHLKHGLHVIPEDWIDCQDPTPKEDMEESPSSHDIDVEAQRRLAALRTDLDSFTDTEAYALMCSGYLMTQTQFQSLQARHAKDGEIGTWGNYVVDAPRDVWEFLKLESALTHKNPNDPIYKDLLKQLKIGQSLVLKAWKLDEQLKVIGCIIIGLAVILGLGIIKAMWSATIFSLSMGGLVTAILLLSVPLLPAGLRKLGKRIKPFTSIYKLSRFEKVYRTLVKDIFIAFIGFGWAKLHLRFIDNVFLKRGSLQRLLNKK